MQHAAVHANQNSTPHINLEQGGNPADPQLHVYALVCV
jgi:hypothetical protein